MKEIEILNGKKIGNAEFIEKGGELYGRIRNYGVVADYKISAVTFEKPAEAVLTDLDGTTLQSEEFWVYIIEKTVKKLLGDEKFSLTDEDVPYVSGFTTVDHLNYCIGKYARGKDINEAVEVYHEIAEEELAKIMRGEGFTSAFKPADGLKEFLLGLKKKKVKIGLATSGLDYKAIPEITAAFRNIGLGNPLEFYDSIITGGRRKDTGDYGTIGEIAAKPHPWIYAELAYSGLKITDSARVIGVEDSAAGVMSLRFAGFAVIGLESGNIAKSGLDCLCEKKVSRLTEILDLI